MGQAFLILNIESHFLEAVIWTIHITVLRLEGGGGLLINSSHLLVLHLLRYHFEIGAHLFEGLFHLQVLL